MTPGAFSVLLASEGHVPQLVSSTISMLPLVPTCLNQRSPWTFSKRNHTVVYVVQFLLLMMPGVFLIRFAVPLLIGLFCRLAVVNRERR